MTERTVWCDKAGFVVTEEEIESECPYWECDCALAMRKLIASEIPRADGVSPNAKED